ncbi:MAG: TonB-dependent receptor [Verrucomicrobia bacterium]|nr:TonB-dependent receptor [Verrucomicrobiota bacterium]
MPNQLLRLVAAALCAVSVALAQTPGGSISGRVQNATNGQYIKNARVAVEGSGLVAVTNEFGDYRLAGVPAGPATLLVTYTGLDSATARVTVVAGQTLEQNFSLGRDGQIVQLDAFTVGAARETNATAISLNEQRFAENIKSVVSADAFGDVTEGNVGEFLKFLPGITVEYTAADIRNVSVRGFNPLFSAVSQDGARVASSAAGGASRAVDFYTVSINNISRVEVTKVPTPDSPADSLGGAVNMISKSAFEHSRREFRYRAYVSMNSEDRDVFRRTPGPGDESTFKVLPGFDFNYILPASSTFGLVINGLSSNQFNEQHRSQPTWRFVGAGATPTAPYLRNYTMQDGPKRVVRDSLSVKADYKPAPGHVLSLTGTVTYYTAFFGNRNINFDVGSSDVPTVATGTALSFSPTFTQGATGRAVASYGASFRTFTNPLESLVLTHRYNSPIWETNAGANLSHSRTLFRDTRDGHFQSFNITLPTASTIRYDNISLPSAPRVTTRDPAGNLLDFTSLANWRLNSVTASPVDGEGTVRGAFFNVKRNLPALPVPASLKAGIDIRNDTRDNRRYTNAWNYVGPDGIAGTADDSAGRLLDTGYTEDPFWGFPRTQWPSPFRADDLFRSNPGYFVFQEVSSATNRINNSERISETVTAAFLRGDLKLLRNRLQLVGGVRFEQTRDTGEGPLIDPDAPFQRNANGTFVTVNGARVRKPEAGAAGSIQELALVRKERGSRVARTYDGYYPSLHATLNVTEDLIARFAYARTLGRPEFSNVIPNTTIDEADTPPAPGGSPGNITLRNTGLKPWTADNWDLSLEYYFGKGGVLSAGVFRKDLENFWGAVNQPLTPALAATLDIDPRYVGWNVSSLINAGSARVTGVEGNFTKTLDFLPRWGRYFSLQTNGTMLHLTGRNDADFSGFIARTGNVGLTFSKAPFVAMVKWNYRGRQKNSAQFGTAPGAYEYFDSRYYLDLNAEYALTKHVTIFANARNVTNSPQNAERYSSETPGYSHLSRSEEYGVQMAFGLKGSF